MKIGVLTSSRADYGIYQPLLEKLREDSFFELEIVAFGTHLSKFHGYTVNEIYKDNFPIIHEINSILTNDDEVAISTAYSLTALKFSDFWKYNKYDLVFCLGDRFEMNAAVQAGIPYRINFAHIHGGETTLGAIDNIYRHQITMASHIHFTAADVFSKKIIQLINDSSCVYTVGSLSLDGINDFLPRKKDEFYKEFGLKEEPFALVTFHPETVNVDKNKDYAKEMKVGLLNCLELINLVITMPNADTLGTIYREEILRLKQEHPDKVILIENFGKTNYFTAMKYATVLIGNTSSGIIEAASFNKYVLNVGNRQDGRLQSENTINIPYNATIIGEKLKEAILRGDYLGNNVYYKGGSAQKIINLIKIL